MPPKPDDPLRKVTTNLYEKDAILMESIYGQGWSEQIRQIVKRHYQMVRAVDISTAPRTLGDLSDD